MKARTNATQRNAHACTAPSGCQGVRQENCVYRRWLHRHGGWAEACVAPHMWWCVCVGGGLVAAILTFFTCTRMVNASSPPLIIFGVGGCRARMLRTAAMWLHQAALSDPVDQEHLVLNQNLELRLLDVQCDQCQNVMCYDNMHRRHSPLQT